MKGRVAVRIIIPINKRMDIISLIKLDVCSIKVADLQFSAYGVPIINFWIFINHRVFLFGTDRFVYSLLKERFTF